MRVSSFTGSLATRLCCLLVVFGVVATNSQVQAQVFNEIRISSPGASDDTSNFFELFGTAGTSFDGLSVLAISNEFNPGSIDFAFDLTGTSIPTDGFFLAGNATEFGAEVDLDITGTDFFGSPVSFLLVDGFTGAAGDDLDADDDGVLDTTPFSSVIDSVSLTDGDSDGDPEFPLSGTVVGPDGTFTPAHIFRTVDGTGDFVVGEFGDFAFDTPGFSNVAVPEPASAGLLGSLAGIVFFRRKRK